MVHYTSALGPNMSPGRPELLETWLAKELDSRFNLVNKRLDCLMSLVSGTDCGAVHNGSVTGSLSEQCDRLSSILSRLSALPQLFHSELTDPSESAQPKLRGMSSLKQHTIPEPDVLGNVNYLPLTVENLALLQKNSSRRELMGEADRKDSKERMEQYSFSVKAEESENASAGTSSRKGVVVFESHGGENSNDLPLALAGDGGGHEERAARDRDKQSLRSSSQGTMSVLMARNRRNVGWFGVMLWKFLEDPDSSRLANAYNWFHTLFVFAGVGLLLSGTIDPPPVNRSTAAILDLCFDGVLLLELCVRLAVCPMTHWRFMQDTFNQLELVSTLLPLSIRIYCGGVIFETLEEGGFAVKLMFCVVPVLRLTKILRSFQKYQLLSAAFVLIMEAIPVLIFTFLILALIFSSALYLVEHGAGTTAFPTMASAVWSTVVPMTTVGYGDTIPATVLGKVLACVLMVISALYMAMPIGIAGNAFHIVWEGRDRILLMKRTCTKIMEWGYNAEDIPALFRQFDVDSSGELDMDEFRQMITEMGIGLSDDRIVALFESIDADGSGAIDDQEFIKCLFPRLYHRMLEKERKERELAEKAKDANDTLTRDATMSWTWAVLSRMTSPLSPPRRPSEVSSDTLQTPPGRAMSNERDGV
jgi:voltage-gated potassium channel